MSAAHELLSVEREVRVGGTVVAVDGPQIPLSTATKGLTALSLVSLPQGERGCVIERIISRRISPLEGEKRDLRTQ